MSGFVSARGKRVTGTRLAIVIAIGVIACAALALVAPLIGVTMGKAGRAIEWLGFAAFDTSSPDHVIVAARLPRVLAALLVGGALAGAGCALQAVLRNPLAEPFTLGISSGSSLAAVIAIRLGIEQWFGALGVGGAALAGAIGTLVLVERLARVGRDLPPATLVLAGVTVSMFCSAASLLVQATGDYSDYLRDLAWMMGGLDAVRLHGVEGAAIPIGIGLVALVAHARSLDALSAGPEVAASLGVAVGRTQLVVFGIASLLVGAAIALAGPIGFVGLIMPHALRALLGPDHRLLLPASIFGGALLLLVCDTLARTILAPAHLLPTGAVTAVLGGPFFVSILINQKRRAAMWGRA